MTNLEIRRLAVRFAEQLAGRSEFPDPDDAWYRWSQQYSVSSPGARHVFELSFQGWMSRSATR